MSGTLRLIISNIGQTCTNKDINIADEDEIMFASDAQNCAIMRSCLITADARTHARRHECAVS